VGLEKGKYLNLDMRNIFAGQILSTTGDAKLVGSRTLTQGVALDCDAYHLSKMVITVHNVAS
jgi:hypothetical protein